MSTNHELRLEFDLAALGAHIEVVKFEPENIKSIKRTGVISGGSNILMMQLQRSLEDNTNVCGLSYFLLLSKGQEGQSETPV